MKLEEANASVVYDSVLFLRIQILKVPLAFPVLWPSLPSRPQSDIAPELETIVARGSCGEERIVEDDIVVRRDDSGALVRAYLVNKQSTELQLASLVWRLNRLLDHTTYQKDD